MHTSDVPAKRLHPFKGFAAIIANEAFPLGVDRLVPVERACCDKSLSAYFTPVRSFASVCPDMSCQVGTVAEALLAHGAAVRLLLVLLAVAVVDVAGVERQTGLLQAAPQTRRRWHKVFNVRLQVVQMLPLVVVHPEIPVAHLVLLLDHRGLWMLLLHTAAAPLLLLFVVLTVSGVLGRSYCRKWLMVSLFRRRRRRWLMKVSRAMLLVWEAVLQPWLWVEDQIITTSQLIKTSNYNVLLYNLTNNRANLSLEALVATWDDLFPNPSSDKCPLCTQLWSFRRLLIFLPLLPPTSRSGKLSANAFRFFNEELIAFTCPTRWILARLHVTLQL